MSLSESASASVRHWPQRQVCTVYMYLEHSVHPQTNLHIFHYISITSHTTLRFINGERYRAVHARMSMTGRRLTFGRDAVIVSAANAVIGSSERRRDDWNWREEWARRMCRAERGISIITLACRRLSNVTLVCRRLSNVTRCITTARVNSNRGCATKPQQPRPKAQAPTCSVGSSQY